MKIYFYWTNNNDGTREVSKREMNRIIKELEWQGIPSDSLINITHIVYPSEGKLIIEVYLDTRVYPNFYLQL